MDTIKYTYIQGYKLQNMKDPFSEKQNNSFTLNQIKMKEKDETIKQLNENKKNLKELAILNIEKSNGVLFLFNSAEENNSAEIIDLRINVNEIKIIIDQIRQIEDKIFELCKTPN
jgi:hypothetical protein